ncbi:MAG: tRNA (N6-isopentenyl adenosine(37)-C2)-methylthiotransferase MiaB [Candidatus Aminicenantes bacterium]|nr:tRNA (N6-isopentenyl adenosine(37)-C2)-methylthiotransferase MiaB [Candidatus Aminicenantes bacterium]
MTQPDLTGIKFFIQTFGCQMNENDSEHIAGLLSAAGARPVAAPDESDLVVINTCAVREKSVDKLYSLLGRLSKFKKDKEFLIGVAGCVAQLYRSDILEKKPFVDFVIGPDNYWKLPEMLKSRFQEKFIATQWYRDWHEIPEIQRTTAVSGYITVMEGCNNFCSYCVVPFTRGREKFRPAQNILSEAEDLASRGYLEVQLLGQNVNSYHDPETGQNFSALLEEVDQVQDLDWIRFVTSHPKNIDPQLIHTMQQAKSICHQLHLPIQAGSEVVLKRMNRGYSRKEYMAIISHLKDAMPDIALSTDIIVGFPGETEADFQQTLDVLEQVRYTNIFSFRYSPRPLTAASRMQDSIPLETKKERLQRVQDLQKELQSEMNQAKVGKSYNVLCYGKSKKDAQVYSGRNYAHQVVNFSSDQECEGKFIKVHITGSGPYSLKGIALD